MWECIEKNFIMDEPERISADDCDLFEYGSDQKKSDKAHGIRATLILYTQKYHDQTGGIAVRKKAFTNTFKNWLRKNHHDVYELLLTYNKAAEAVARGAQ
jgi:hypothetical protein